MLKNIGKEWKLTKMNDNAISIYYPRRLYLIFNTNKTYEVHIKKDGKRQDIWSDNIIDQNWFFDKNGNLNLTSFT